jgi:CRISPR-associated protein (TIGR02584 family)
MKTSASHSHFYSHSRRILLVVTGLSPQVVTETLYALAVRGKSADARFIPTEIHLLTTQKGRQLARASLLHPDGGQFHALLKDYPQIGAPLFDERHIHVIRGADGADLEDIRTPEENAAAADTITALVADLTQDADAQLHVSIAGGRKTMGFYLGYAFSLFARPQDQLSHVLVSAPFENHPDFYFPPATPRRLALSGGAHIDTAEAEITLAEIPVVRLRHGLPEALQNGRARFNEAVAAIQKSLLPPHLAIDLVRRKVRCGETEFSLPPILFAWLAWWAMQAKNRTPMKSWREFEPEAKEYLALYERIVGPDSAYLEGTVKRLQNDTDTKTFFEENNAKLTQALKKALGAFEARPYQLIREGRRGHVRRGLGLPPDAVTLRSS